MTDDNDGRLYLLVLTTLRLIPPGTVVDAIPNTTLAALGHTRDSACERLADPDFWIEAPRRAAALVGDPPLHERYAVNEAQVAAVRVLYGRVES